ncbi:MAG TPA: sulfatase [Tepidisphaeraceae bacterium]|nr:sulfatase [Tepidisphaeraceae bacterium]
MKRLHRFILTAVASLTAVSLRPQMVIADQRPNIVVVLADDLGYADLGAQGSGDIPTPHIDSIARAGARFTQAYVTCPICAPSRAGLLTGRYQQRFGFDDNGGPDPEANFGIPMSEKTIAESLKAAGYRTGIVGKWDVGIREGRRPNDRGFDEFFGFLPGVNDYIRRDKGETAGLLGRPLTNGRSAPIYRNHEIVDEPDYLTDAFAREAVRFIQQSDDRPFFLFLPFNAVHNPMSAPKAYLERFPNLQKDRRIYAAMISAVDDAVGQIMQSLSDRALDRNTLVIFLSDNGGASGQGYAASSPARNDPLGGRKGTFWEGGIRVPMLISWPAKIAAGQTLSQPVSSLDVLPTSLAAAQARHLSQHALDGKDLLPLLLGENAAAPHETLYWRYHRHFAIRESNWKLIALENRAVQLFDLDSDIGETKNLAQAHPEIVRHLRARLDQWAADLPKPAWVRRTVDAEGRAQYVPLPIYEPESAPTP